MAQVRNRSVRTRQSPAGGATRPRGALTDAPPAESLAKRILLLSGVTVASVAAWTGAPLFALWVGSQAQEGGPPTMLAIAIVVLTLAVVEGILALVLSALNDRYDAAIGRRPATRRPPPWHSSLRGERDDQVVRDEGVTAVERVVALSCGAAFLSLEIWFFFFAGSSLPNA